MMCTSVMQMYILSFFVADVSSIFNVTVMVNYGFLISLSCAHPVIILLHSGNALIKHVYVCFYFNCDASVNVISVNMRC